MHLTDAPGSGPKGSREMMQNCPKCGFSQPKDRYCANCGVDMDLYQPRQAPLFLRLAGNWIVQLSLLVAIVLSALAYIRLQNSAALRERVSEIDNARTVRVSERPRAATPPPSVPAQVAQLQPSPTPPPENSAIAMAPTPATPPTPAAPTGTAVSKIAETYLGDKDHAAGSGGTTAAPKELRLIFAEVQRPYFNEMLSETRNLASYGPFNAGNLTDIATRLKTGRAQNAFRVLDSAFGLTLKLNQPQVIFKGARDPILDQNLGVTTQITPTQIDDDGAHLQIEITRTIKEPAGSNPPISTQNYQEQITLNKQNGGFIAGVLPHRNLDLEETKTLGNMGILKVMTSGDFQSNSSEFVIFLQAQ